MDDSVIKVLRRNGSWNKGNSKDSENSRHNFDTDNKNDFTLDENFGVLAEEIKKRMKQKVESNKGLKSIKAEDKDVFFSEEVNRKKNIKSSVKKQLLPYLKEIEQLISERELYSEKVNGIDVKLEEVKNSIGSIKEDYENNIRELQENINFFDESIDLINNVKGEH